ncbi:ParA family protein [Actinotalea ferrariae]|uniref:ParA family protein n=1 Tax=Actinotalea ferrariae TaxID=1386098 RepID=UPI001C8CB11A|nr:ParA family protein [Actinotalea ferrariae]MBX9244637.1 ParA family protein [Actinotalea ferrariae]
MSVDREALMRVIAVINGKGGAGKTSITANVAGMVANSGFRVLVVDSDPQGNLAEDLGYTGTDVDDEGQALAAALAFGQPGHPVTDVRPNLDVLIGGHHLDAAAAALSAAKDQAAARLALARVLEPLAPAYDLILIDCPPGIEALQNAAAAAARWALVPAKSDASSRKGMLDVARRLDAVVDLNPGLDLLGVVLFGTGTSAHRIKEEARARIVEALGAEDVVLRTTIRHSEATAHAARERGLLVHELEDEVRKGPSWWQIRRGEAEGGGGPRTAGGVADDYQSLATEIVDRITAAEQALAQEVPA